MNFEAAVERVLAHEGGYSNNPADPGGETQWGISKRAYPGSNIRTLTREQAKEFYRRDYWDKVGCDKLPGAIAFQVFDFAVNSGVGLAVKMLQRAVLLPEDGELGPKTVQAVSRELQGQLVLTYLGLRLTFMTALKNWPSASGGWSRRIAVNMQFAAKDL